MTIHRSSTMTSSNTTDDEPPALNAAAVPIDNDSSPPPPQLRSMHDKSTATPIIFTTSTATQTAAARAAAPAAPNKAVGGGGGGCCSADGCVRNLSYQVSNTLGELFYRLGFTVATHPWNTIIVSWLLVICCSMGMLYFHNEKNPVKLWIPKDSKFVRDTEWIMKTMEIGYRTQSVLITAPDVLTPEVMHKIALITDEVSKLSANAPNGTTLRWSDVCFKIPIIAHLPQLPKAKTPPPTDPPPPSGGGLLDSLFGNPPPSAKPRRPFNPAVDLNPFVYCALLDNLPLGCMSENLLDLWKLSAERIRRLTRDDILDALAGTAVNPVTGHDTDFVHLLGDVRRNASGHITGAGSLLTHWMVFVNFTDVNHEKIGNAAGTEDWASEEALAWEAEFLRVMAPLRESLSRNGTQVWYSAGRSFGDISAATMFQDMDKVFIGSTLMFVYMQLVLSRFSWTEMRIMFGGVGLMSVGMAYAAGIGVCSVLGVPYGPVHTSLPFLLMGLGVDDIFVLMSCWRQVAGMNTGCTLPERMGLTLRHAGSSITVTSITDVVAFLIGASTILPSLESFCTYAAVAVFIMYLLVVTFVVAILTLDERRLAQRRNAFVPCIVHSADEAAKLWCDANLMQRALKALYTRAILTPAGKVIVVMSVLAVSAFSMRGLLRLEQRFDPNWFIPQSTYLAKYLAEQERFYPDAGHEASIFVGAVDYPLEMGKLLRTVEAFEARDDLVEDVIAWVVPFREFVRVHFEKDIASETLSADDWHAYLSKFLFSSAGGRFQANFKFGSKLTCGLPAGNVTVSTIPFRHRRFGERNAYVPAMHEVERLVDAMRVRSGDGVATVWGKVYGNWITDEVIDTEVLRNILLALVCVMACTLVMIAEPLTCTYIFVCVLLTLVDVCGFMQMWGLTVDLVSCIGLELAVGLCVDYAAHVGHTFLQVRQGTRDERALETVQTIGAAVLYGGGSTLLALAMLAVSEAYTFQAFFKIFLLVIVFGLFHGVVFLPVLLSIIGPAPLMSKEDRLQQQRRAAADGDATRSPPIDDDESVSFIAGVAQRRRLVSTASQDKSSIRTDRLDIESIEMLPEQKA